MSQLRHIANRVLNTPLFVEPGYARVFFNSMTGRIGINNLYDIDGRIDSVDKLRVRAGSWDEDDRPAATPVAYRISERVAVLPISGTLVHKHGYLQPYSGMTGYDGIIARLKLALADSKVSGVLLDNDTPGGEVAGCFDASREIRRLSQQAGKPVWALAYDMNASAGMALASAADRRLITQTGIAGSVGVLMAHANWEAYLKNEGVDVTLIYSGAHKVDGNPYGALPDDVLATLQLSMDTLRAEFAALVSELTGMDVNAVLATEARCYRGQEAVDVGFADELVNGNEAISIFAEYLRSYKTTTVTTTSTGATRMSLTTEEQQGAAATQTTTAAAASGAPAADAAAAEQPNAKSAERTRISTILGSAEAIGRGQLANHLAMSTDMSAEDAIALLATAAQESEKAGASPLERAMNAQGKTAIGGAIGAEGQGNELDRVMGNYHMATGKGQQN